MDMQKLNDWLQLATGIGVIAGLLLVATEIRQNAAMTRAEMNSDTMTAMAELSRSKQQEPLAKALAKSYELPLELSTEQRVSLDGFYEEAYLQVAREVLFIMRGIYDDGDLDGNIARFAKTVLSSEYGRAWWEEYKLDLVGAPELTERIDKWIAQSPPEPEIERHKRVDEILRRKVEQ